MIAEAINAYMAVPHGPPSAENVVRFQYALGIRLARQKQIRAGRLHASDISHPCARKSYFKYTGASEKPLSPETQRTFALGDWSEAYMILHAYEAGVPILDGQRGLTITRDGIQVQCHPDGRLEYQPDHWRVVEFKSCSDYAYQMYLKKGINNDFGYLAQGSLGVAAFREAGEDVADEIEFVLFNKQSSEIASVTCGYSAAAVEEAIGRGNEVLGNLPGQNLPGAGIPPIPFAAQEEVDWKSHQPTGRKLMPLQCRYCAFQASCWQPPVIEKYNFKKLIEAEKWVLPEPENA